MQRNFMVLPTDEAMSAHFVSLGSEYCPDHNGWHATFSVDGDFSAPAKVYASSSEAERAGYNAMMYGSEGIGDIVIRVDDDFIEQEANAHNN